MKLRFMLAMLIPVLVLVGLGFIPNNLSMAYPDLAYPTWSSPAYGCFPPWTQVQVEWTNPPSLVLPFPYQAGNQGGILFIYRETSSTTIGLIYDGFVGGRYRWHSFVPTLNEPMEISGYVNVKNGGSIWIYPDRIYPHCWADYLYYLPYIRK